MTGRLQATDSEDRITLLPRNDRTVPTPAIGSRPLSLSSVCTYTWHSLYVKVKDNLKKLVSSFHHMGPGN